MSDPELLERLALDVFERHARDGTGAASDPSRSRDLWGVLEQTGLTRVGLSERMGGSGGGWRDIDALLRVAARYPATVPLAETLLAAGVLEEAGLDVPSGPLTVMGHGVRIDGRDGHRRLQARTDRVPFARDANAIVALGADGARGIVAIVPRASCTVTNGANVAGEARDGVTFDIEMSAVAHAEMPALSIRGGGALTRSIQIAGALTRVLELTSRYVGIRRQFGRRLVEFQAVQQELALLAGEAAAADAAAHMALSAVVRVGGSAGRAPEHCLLEIGAAKVRTASAGTEGARLAHQLHGAIGMTHEHELRHHTSRIWSWRDEFGAENEWAAWLGRSVSSLGGAGAWAMIATDEMSAT